MVDDRDGSFETQIEEEKRIVFDFGSLTADMQRQQLLVEFEKRLVAQQQAQEAMLIRMGTLEHIVNQIHSELESGEIAIVSEPVVQEEESKQATRNEITRFTVIESKMKKQQVK